MHNILTSLKAILRALRELWRDEEVPVPPQQAADSYRAELHGNSWVVVREKVVAFGPWYGERARVRAVSLAETLNRNNARRVSRRDY